ncbi:MAG: cell division inhibitor SepF [Actinomycetota bacterium]|jgi:cell division inhibitor SepF|nr:cell division inhibitor SepF [Actinomycetota bacterium]
MAGIWKKTLIYLGLVEEDDLTEFGYDDYAEAEAPPPARKGGSLKRVSDQSGNQRRDAVVRAMPTPTPGRLHLLHPTAFNDAQELGDKFREGYSVIMNLQAADPDLSRRLIDFASGLVYGLAGSMQPVAERVFLLTPAGVQVSAEERRRFLEERGFFNQA